MLFLCERNPLTGHYHYDRGSFVLEANGKILFPDLGTTNYSNMNTAYMRKKEYHSTIYPKNDTMTVMSNTGLVSAKMAGHPITEELTLDMLYTPEAKIIFATETENGVNFKADLASLFSKNVKCGTREGKLAILEDSGVFEIIDEWQFDNADSINANFLCYGKWNIEKDGATANVDGTKVKISFSEENGYELFLTTDESMTDYDGKFVSVLRVKTEKVNLAKITTRIEYIDR